MFIPGNHDLTTLRTIESRVLQSGYQFDAEEKAAYGFVHYLLKAFGTNWKVATSVGNKPLAAVFHEVQDFLHVYERNKPRLRPSAFLIRDRLRLRRLPHHIWELTPSYFVSDELIAAARGSEGAFPWPSRDFFLMKDLVAIAYPQVFYENDSFIVIGLNSCFWRPEHLLTSAFGRLGRNQIDRLSQLLTTVRDKCKLIMLHHHLGMPCGFLDSHLIGADIDFVRLTDGPELAHVLSEHQRVIVLNGHKHIGYHASIEYRMKVISSASLAYGDKERRDRSNCYIYRVTPGGDAYVSDETQITAHA